MDIKMMVGDKEIISPSFDFRLNESESAKDVLMLCIHGFSKKEQNEFLTIVKNLTNEDLFINPNYIAIKTAKKVYFFNLKEYKDNKFENLITIGYYDFMFAFIDEKDIIIDIEYVAMKLNGHKIKEL